MVGYVSADMVQARAMLLKVVNEYARPRERLDQLELDPVLPGQRVPERELSGRALVDHVFEGPRAERPSRPEPDAEVTMEFPDGGVKVFHHERDLRELRKILHLITL